MHDVARPAGIATAVRGALALDAHLIGVQADGTGLGTVGVQIAGAGVRTILAEASRADLVVLAIGVRLTGGRAAPRRAHAGGTRGGRGAGGLPSWAMVHTAAR